MESILTSKNSENSRTPKKYVSIKELSAILGRSENSLRYHYRMGRIKPTIRFGRTYSFNLDEVIEQLKKDFTSTE
jgi:DNA-binding transcriptional MerR regulator